MWWGSLHRTEGSRRQVGCNNSLWEGQPGKSQGRTLGGWHSRWVWTSGNCGAERHPGGEDNRSKGAEAVNDGCHGDRGRRHIMPHSRGTLRLSPLLCLTWGRHLRSAISVCCVKISQNGLVLVWLYWKTPNSQTKKHSSSNLHAAPWPWELQAHGKWTD